MPKLLVLLLLLYQWNALLIETPQPPTCAIDTPISISKKLVWVCVYFFVGGAVVWENIALEIYAYRCKVAQEECVRYNETCKCFRAFLYHYSYRLWVVSYFSSFLRYYIFPPLHFSVSIYLLLVSKIETH